MINVEKSGRHTVHASKSVSSTWGFIGELIVGPSQRAVKANNLETLIQQAREENPLPDMNSHIDKSSRP